MVRNSSVCSSSDPFSAIGPDRLLPLPSLEHVRVFNVLSAFSIELVPVYLGVSDLFDDEVFLHSVRTLHSYISDTCMRGSFNQVLPPVVYLPAVAMLFFWCCCLVQYSRPRVFMQFLVLRIFAVLFLSFLIRLLPLFRVYRPAFAICFYVVKRICHRSVSVLLMQHSWLHQSYPAPLASSFAPAESSASDVQVLGILRPRSIYKASFIFDFVLKPVSLSVIYVLFSRSSTQQQETPLKMPKTPYVLHFCVLRFVPCLTRALF